MAKWSNRPDDRDETIIRKRYQVYKTETEAVAEHYQKLGKLERIKGEGTVEDIFTALSSSIESEMAAQASSVSQ